MEMVPCKICGSQSQQLFKYKVLNKYQVWYYKCPACNFIQTEDPYWMNEAYAQAISSLDIGLIFRNRNLITPLKLLINFFFNPNKKFLDYGGGYGMLVRMMRDEGYNFYRQDRFCENLFAKHFDVGDIKDDPSFELMVAFEVFEHLPEPLKEIKTMLNFSENIFFSTELQPHQNIHPDNWWYFVPETGQHVSIYSLESLREVARILSLNFYTNGYNFHLLTRKKMNRFLYKLLFHPIGNRFLKLLIKRRKSLLHEDFLKVRKLYGDII